MDQLNNEFQIIIHITNKIGKKLLKYTCFKENYLLNNEKHEYQWIRFCDVYRIFQVKPIFYTSFMSIKQNHQSTLGMKIKLQEIL